MIKAIRLQNWKSFEDATLYIDPLSVFIGPNAGGKSNALEALVFLQRVVNGLDVRTALAGNQLIPPLRGDISGCFLDPAKPFTLSVMLEAEGFQFQAVAVDTLTITYTVSVQLFNHQPLCVAEYFVTDYPIPDDIKAMLKLFFEQSEGPLSEEPTVSFINSTTMQGVPVGITAPALDEPKTTFSLPTEFSTILNDHAQEKIPMHDQLSLVGSVVDKDGKGFPDTGRFSDDLRELYFSFPSKIISVFEFFVLDPIPAKIRSYSRFSTELSPDAGNLAGFIAALSEEDQRRMEKTFAKYLTHLPEKDIKKIHAEPVGRLGSDAMLYCEEEWTPGETRLIDARSMSDGTLRFLAILTALLTRPPGSLLVIEEVDSGLHPSRMHLLLQAIREIGAERRVDVLVTTHNPALLDNLGPGMMPFVQTVYRNPKTGASEIIPLDEVRQLSKLLASGPLGKITTQGDLEASLKMQGGGHE